MGRTLAIHRGVRARVADWRQTSLRMERGGETPPHALGGGTVMTPDRPKEVAPGASRGPGAERWIGDFEDGSLDYVFSSHCLEHIEVWRTALAEWVRKLRPSGHILLYLPHPDCAIWRPGSPFVGDGHKWVPTLGAIED